MSTVIPLFGRHRAYLRAVADNRAELTCSRVPDLYIDGLACCDQRTAHQLLDAHLIARAEPGARGQCVPAVLTAPALNPAPPARPVDHPAALAA